MGMNNYEKVVVPNKKIKPGKPGKTYRILHGPGKDQVGTCLDAWETGFGHQFLKVKTAIKVFSVRAEDVERVKS